MPEFTIIFDCYCEVCGVGLCHTVEVEDRSSRGCYISLPPCERCLDAKGEEEYDKGYDEVRKEGYDTGYVEGYVEG